MAISEKLLDGMVEVEEEVDELSIGLNGEQLSNDAAVDIAYSEPYSAFFRIKGTADLLFHRWSNEAVAEKAGAAKNSRAKKTDNVESYVYRCPNGHIGLPGEYLRMSLIDAARFRQDPRSPRKSARDLYKAGIISMTPMADLGKATWDYEDRRRVKVQQAAVTRVRPAFVAGWEAEFVFAVLLPEYISPGQLHATLIDAGRLCGTADFRPTFGRYQIVHFETSKGA